MKTRNEIEMEDSTKRRTRLNERTNLLEMENHHYEVQDIPDPNLFREFFEYTEIPKVGFQLILYRCAAEITILFSHYLPKHACHIFPLRRISSGNIQK